MPINAPPDPSSFEVARYLIPAALGMALGSVAWIAKRTVGRVDTLHQRLDAIEKAHLQRVADLEANYVTNEKMAECVRKMENTITNHAKESKEMTARTHERLDDLHKTMLMVVSNTSRNGNGSN